MPMSFDGPNVLTLTRLTPIAAALAGTWQGAITEGGQSFKRS
jgi:hypothetical protein